MRRVTEEELAGLLDRFAPGRHPKVAAALRELADRRAEDSRAVREDRLVERVVARTSPATLDIRFDDLRSAQVTRLRAALHSGEPVDIDLQALGHSAEPRVLRMVVIRQDAFWGGEAKPGVQFRLREDG